MKRCCAHCGSSKFGMIRYYITSILDGSKHFCSKKCKDDFKKAEQERVRVWQYQRWLYSRPP